MPRHPMPWRSPSTDSQESSPPGSIKSAGSHHSKRERVKEAVDHFFDKFRHHHHHRSHSRRSSFDATTQTSPVAQQDAQRPKSLISIPAERPAPIPISTVPHMESFSSMSSTGSDGSYKKKRRSLSIGSSSTRSLGDAEARHALSPVEEDAAQNVASELEANAKQVASLPPPELPVEPAQASTDAEETAEAPEPVVELGDSVVIVEHSEGDEPSETLTTAEERMASLSPELHPAPMPDDVEGLPLDAQDALSGDESDDAEPRTPPATYPESMPIIVHIDDAPVEVSIPEMSSVPSQKNTLPSPPVINIIPPSAAPSAQNTPVAPVPPSSLVKQDSTLPSLFQYIYGIVAPHKQALHRFRPNLGYSLTFACYGLTWWLVTKTPPQTLF